LAGNGTRDVQNKSSFWVTIPKDGVAEGSPHVASNAPPSSEAAKKQLSLIALVVVAVFSGFVLVLGAVFKTPVLKAADAILGISDFFADRISARLPRDIDAGYSQFFVMHQTPRAADYILNFYAESGQKVTVTLTGNVRGGAGALPLRVLVDLDTTQSVSVPDSWLEGENVTSLLKFGRGAQNVHSVRVVPGDLVTDEEALVNLVVLVHRRSPLLPKAP
jgi:hypothetical protein